MNYVLRQWLGWLSGVLFMRHRRRCPNCDAIGTWKSHGDLWATVVHVYLDRRGWGTLDAGHLPRRLCKCCGYFRRAPEWWLETCYADRVENTWRLVPVNEADEPPLGEYPELEEGRRYVRPERILRRGYSVWPWKG